MPFKPWIRNISPLGWLLGISAIANVVTMLAALYIAVGTPRVYVADGYITSHISSGPGVFDIPIRVQISK
jgi:hypothetical protein